jgi:acyl-homoserine-lactone acylase
MPVIRFLLCFLLLIATGAEAATPAEPARWQAQANRVTITRDDWGIAHVRGRRDADAVFLLGS